MEEHLMDGTGSVRKASVTRRGFVAAVASTGIGAVAAACAPAAAPPAAPAPGAPAGGTKPAWEADWEKLVADAKKEGKLVAQTLPGEGYRRVFDAFEKAFPGITVEHTAVFASTWAPKTLQERKAGVYSWDTTQIPPITGFSVFPEGLYDPIRPLIMRPDVTDNAVWNGGYELGFLDNDKKWVFQTGWDLSGGLFVNTDLVPEGEIKSIRDILNPKWKGKILSFDPRTGGAAATPLTVARLKHGDDFLKQLYADQGVVLSREPRQIMESLVKGGHSIGIGTTATLLEDFKKEGLGKNVKLLLIEDFSYLAGEVIWLVNRAPHPNAAKLYVNWLLSKEGQQVFSKAVVANSRRKDVEKADPQTYPPEGAEKRFLSLYQQDKWEQVEGTRAAAREILK